MVRNIRSINIYYALDPWFDCLTQLDTAVNNLTAANATSTVEELTNVLLTSDAGLCLDNYASRLGVGWSGQIELYATLASNNVQAFSNLALALAYTLLLKLFSASRFEPTVSVACSVLCLGMLTFRIRAQKETYDLLNEYISATEAQDSLQDDAFNSLVVPLYTSSQPALTVMVRPPSLQPCTKLIIHSPQGGYLVCLAGLKAFNPHVGHPDSKIAIAGRAIVGTILLLSTLLK